MHSRHPGHEVDIPSPANGPVTPSPGGGALTRVNICFECCRSGHQSDDRCCAESRQATTFDGAVGVPSSADPRLRQVVVSSPVWLVVVRLEVAAAQCLQRHIQNDVTRCVLSDEDRHLIVPAWLAAVDEREFDRVPIVAVVPA